MKTKQIILALLLSAAPVFAQEGPNLLTNPGFEAMTLRCIESPSGWDVSNLLPDHRFFCSSNSWPQWGLQFFY